MRKKHLRTAAKRRRKSVNHVTPKSSHRATRRRRVRRAKKAQQTKS